MSYFIGQIHSERLQVLRNMHVLTLSCINMPTSVRIPLCLGHEKQDLQKEIVHIISKRFSDVGLRLSGRVFGLIEETLYYLKK